MSCFFVCFFLLPLAPFFCFLSFWYFLVHLLSPLLWRTPLAVGRGRRMDGWMDGWVGGWMDFAHLYLVIYK